MATIKMFKCQCGGEIENGVCVVCGKSASSGILKTITVDEDEYNKAKGEQPGRTLVMANLTTVSANDESGTINPEKMNRLQKDLTKTVPGIATPNVARIMKRPEVKKKTLAQAIKDSAEESQQPVQESQPDISNLIQSIPSPYAPQPIRLNDKDRGRIAESIFGDLLKPPCTNPSSTIKLPGE